MAVPGYRPSATATYSLHFYVADFGNAGTYNDYFSGHGDTLTVSTVPEPASLAVLTGGLLGLAFVRRRGNRHRSVL